MTEQLKKKLQDEINTLEHELSHELPKELKKAVALGDLSLDPVAFGIPQGLAGLRGPSHQARHLVTAGLQGPHERGLQQFAEAMSGLSEGDRVIVSDQDKFRSGQPVRQRSIDIARAPKKP